MVDTRWFQARKAELGISDATIATAIGRERSVVSKLLNGKVAFDPVTVPAFAKVLEVAPDEVLVRFGVLDAPAPRGPEADNPVTKRAHRDDDTVEILQVDFSWSMGPGTSVDDYIEETPVRFDLDYIRSFTRTAPAKLRIGRGVGDSMFPTLVSSDLVWIDTTQRMLNQADRIWAISLYGAAGIKRLRTIGPNRVLVMSDNPSVPDQEVDADDLVIGGRVIRFSRDL
jgi:phage repressor protein C with HTH and peptisase S24 domain